MSPNIPLALAGIYNRIGTTLHCICGPDATYDLLLMEVFFAEGHWWLSGYDNCEIGEPLDIKAADVMEWVEVD